HDPAPTQIYTLSLHDALPISTAQFQARGIDVDGARILPLSAERQISASRGTERLKVCESDRLFAIEFEATPRAHGDRAQLSDEIDRKSTRLNSSHRTISYAVF